MNPASTWLVALSWLALVAGFASAAVVLMDIRVRGYRQPMAVMEWVWPVTGLYLGPAAVRGYARFGRPSSARWQREHGVVEAPGKPWWSAVAVGVSHCGAGCTLGDIIAEFTVFGAGLTIAGEALWAEYVGDYLLAVLLGVVFQFFAIAPMRGLGLRDGLVAALKADVVSLTAFEVGLFGWMAVMRFVLFTGVDRVRPDSPVYWFGMQLGMILGALSAYPVNVRLIRAGVKEAM